MTSAMAIGLTVFASLIGAFGALFFKLGSSHLTFSIKKLITNWRLHLGVLFYLSSTVFFIWALALKGSELSVVYPVVALTYVWVELLSIKFLNENMSLVKWAGVALIIIGVSFIGFS